MSGQYIYNRLADPREFSALRPFRIVAGDVLDENGEKLPPYTAPNPACEPTPGLWFEGTWGDVCRSMTMERRWWRNLQRYQVGCRLVYRRYEPPFFVPHKEGDWLVTAFDRKMGTVRVALKLDPLDGWPTF